MISATDSWLSQVKYVLQHGQSARDTREILASRISWNLNYPLVTVQNRHANYHFAYAEAAYIISGNNRVEFLTNHGMKSFAKYGTDDGVFQPGAYGPPFVDQVPYILDIFKRDPDTRQAVISIWRPRPYASKDIPCTLTLQFIQRNGEMNVIVNMRSSDVWRGLVYDIFCFSCMAAMVSHYCGPYPLGTGYLTAGSSHLYDRDADKAESLVLNPGECTYGPKLEPMGQDQLFDLLMNAREEL
jgi:thymidylate synthase